MRVLPKEMITKLSRETGFERPELDAYWEQWTFMANTDWRDDPDDINLAMDRKTFERCLVPSGGYRHATPSLIFDRMFSFYDTNKDDLIGFPEFLHGLAYRKKRDKWAKIFEGYDIDGDGYVDRKDFLRMFRSYYVLYRHMHRDMLEGLDEQQMSSMDAHRLVSSRQPLSSAFGQDGRYPPAPDPRTGEGKTSQPNGDLDIIDGKGVIKESSDDTGDREDILRTHWSGGRNIWNDVRSRSRGGYWDAMLSPPQSVEQMPEILSNLTRAQGQVEDALHILSSSNGHSDTTFQHTVDSEDSSSDGEGGFTSSPENGQAWLPSSVNVAGEDAEAIDGQGTRVSSARRSSRRAVITQAIHRERAEREIHERWKRRQFYTDEEEGATPPANWNEADDILNQNGLAGESSKNHSQTRNTLHSRSSSKVRFAEDMEDFETRSNPSTSSRSVPERWGGMEIPDAERDAGKEILYQVTQQAFNELLDPLFKVKEDQALEAASTAADREKYKTSFMTAEFEEWALEKEAEAEKKRIKVVVKTTPVVQQQMWPGFPRIPEVEAEEAHERPLEDLLAATGYTLALGDGSDDLPELADISSSDQPPHEPEHHADVADLISPVESSRSLNMVQEGNCEQVAQAPPSRPPTSPSEVLSILAHYDDSDVAATQPTSPEHIPTRPAADSTSSANSHRDPTLPQFRPNSIPLPVSPEYGEGEADTRPTPIEPMQSASQNAASEVEAPLLQGEIDKETLYRLWRGDRAIRDAEKRGGWGRLNLEEFESLVKRFIGEGKGNQMDYLGSWIEICIPWGTNGGRG